MVVLDDVLEISSHISTDVTMTDRTETPREEVHTTNPSLYVCYTKGAFLYDYCCRTWER